jgi:hypothetical protein
MRGLLGLMVATPLAIGCGDDGGDDKPSDTGTEATDADGGANDGGADDGGSDDTGSDDTDTAATDADGGSDDGGSDDGGSDDGGSDDGGSDDTGSISDCPELETGILRNTWVGNSPDEVCQLVRGATFEVTELGGGIAIGMYTPLGYSWNQCGNHATETMELTISEAEFTRATTASSWPADSEAWAGVGWHFPVQTDTTLGDCEVAQNGFIEVGNDTWTYTGPPSDTEPETSCSIDPADLNAGEVNCLWDGMQAYGITPAAGQVYPGWHLWLDTVDGEHCLLTITHRLVISAVDDSAVTATVIAEGELGWGTACDDGAVIEVAFDNPETRWNHYSANNMSQKWSLQQVERHAAATLATESKFGLEIGAACPELLWPSTLASGGSESCITDEATTTIVGFSEHGHFAICEVAEDAPSVGTLCDPGTLYAYPHLDLSRD